MLLRDRDWPPAEDICRTQRSLLDYVLNVCVGIVCIDPHLIVLVQLAAEGHGEVGGCTRGAVAGKQILSILKGAAPAFAYVHVLEAGLDAVG